MYICIQVEGGGGEGNAHFSTQPTLIRVVRLKYENQKLFIRPQDMPQHHLYFDLLMRWSGHGVNCIYFLGTMLFYMMSINVRKLSRRRLPITFVYFVSHASAQALRPITFTQRFRTTRHLFSIQLLWKPEIINVEDKQTKFERSKGDLDRVSEFCK